MRYWVVLLAVLIGPGAWGRQAVVGTRDGQVYQGQIWMDSNRLLIASATHGLHLSIDLTNLVDVRFLADLPRWPDTELEAKPRGFPSSWSSATIGNLEEGGDTRYFSGVFQNENSGTNIAGNNDAFGFIYKRVKGDSEIITRVLQVRGTTPWAKAGLMMRESLQSDAPNVLLAAQARGGVFQARELAGAETKVSPLRELSVPYWLKLKRDGNTFSAYASRGGGHWSLVERVELPMEEEIYVGLAVTGARELPVVSTEANPQQAARHIARSYVRASLDSVVEAPFLPSPFVPRIQLNNGSMAVARIDRADDASIQFAGGLLAPEPIPTAFVSSILFHWVPARCERFLKLGRPGVILTTGEFVEGDFKGIAGNRLKFSSVLMGLRTYDLNHDLLAVILRPTQLSPSAIEVRTEDGSVWYGQSLQMEKGDLLINQPLLGVRRVPIYDLRGLFMTAQR